LPIRSESKIYANPVDCPAACKGYLSASRTRFFRYQGFRFPYPDFSTPPGSGRKRETTRNQDLFMEINIIHDQEGQEFTAALGQEQAEMSYAKPQEKVIDFQHTFVPEKFRRKGVASKLIKAGLQYAADQQWRVIASCPAVAAYIRRHAEYQPLLKTPV
jgi:predicted GNAT family acetyltransferase